MDRLQIRAYNVRFGSSVLVSLPDRGPSGATTTRHILIDFGNLPSESDPEDEGKFFGPVVDDILQHLDGRPLDLFVMTHEHLDHVRGLAWALDERGTGIIATHAWLTASSAPDYYDRFDRARKKKFEAMLAYGEIASALSADSVPSSPTVEALMLNNNPTSTAECLMSLRALAGTTSYVCRGSTLNGTHPFEEAEFDVWGPELDTSIYYSELQPMALGVTPYPDDFGPRKSPPRPPAGVDAGAFYNLVARRRDAFVDNLVAIDQAANNSSLVFKLEWRGWRLLFTGDAEQQSWQVMDRRGVLEPVHFLKIGHHGSRNGTPLPPLLEKILPRQKTDARLRRALVSTQQGVFDGVPCLETVDEVGDLCDEVFSVGEPGDRRFVDIEFEG